MNDTTRFDAHLDEEVEHALAAYASARLTPDRWATNRMRVAIIEHAATAAATPVPVGGVARALLGFRRLGFVALVGALAISAGTAAGVAASPGGPLYGLRVEIETALLPSGVDRTDAQVGLLTERSDELSEAIKSGNQAGQDAAGDQYSHQLDNAVNDAVDGSSGPTAAEIAAQRADLLILQAACERQIAHLQSLIKPNDTASTNLLKLIAKTEASLATINAKLAALPSP